ACQLDDEVIAEDAPHGLVSAGSVLFAPLIELAGDGHFARRERLDSGKPAPVLTRRLFFEVADEAVEFGLRPGGAAAGGQSLRLPLVDCEQMLDVLDGVSDLAVGLRPAAPVGSRFLAMRFEPQLARHERVVAERKAAAEEPLGYLHVEQFFGSRGGVPEAEPH